MFGDPNHSSAESHQLYNYLNQQAEKLLQAGLSVIFDTNFNYRYDRHKLRIMAATHSADTKLVWIKVNKATAQARALHESHAKGNKYRATMTPEDFERMSHNLQPPEPDEKPIILDGTKITAEYVARSLGLPLPRELPS